MKRNGISHIIAVLLLIVIVTVGAILVYLWVGGFLAPKETHEETFAQRLKVEGIKLVPEGSLIVYVRNIGDTKVHVDHIFITTTSGVIVADFPASAEIDPGEVEMLVFPSMSIRRDAPQEENYILQVTAKSGIVGYSSIDGKFVREALSRQTRPLCMVANPWGSDRYHWAVFRYTDGYFKMYGNYFPSGTVLPDTGVPVEEEGGEGYAPILIGVDEYTISTSWVSWSNRPVDSPLIIVYNPTGGREDWVFTWHDPHGTYRFLFQSLGENAAVDFIVFWEDLYYPTTPPGSIDDWKDHVVRVTIFVNGTYRLAVYMAKGGYRQMFYVGVSEPYETIPWTQTPAYVKPTGAYWWTTSGGYIVEDPGKIWYVTP